MDSTRIPICRPKGNANQRSVYNRKSKHNAGALCVMGMDGMIIDVFTDLVGRHNDRGFCNASGINGILATVQLNNPRQFKAYTDKGFTDHTHIVAAHHGPGALTVAMEFANNRIKKHRVFEEIGFGKVTSRNPFLNNTSLMKLQLTMVVRYIRVAVLLTNAHTCMEGCSTQLHFGVMPPTLESYFE